MTHPPGHMLAPAEEGLIGSTDARVGRTIASTLHPDGDGLRLETDVLSSLPVAATAPIMISKRGGLPPRSVRQVRQYVSAHIDQKISIQTLAALVGLSKFHFCRAFKRSEGITPLRFVLRCRVTWVAHLLATTELPLSRIAFAAGFADQSHCTRRFRELIGITPSRYRWLIR